MVSLGYRDYFLAMVGVIHSPDRTFKIISKNGYGFLPGALLLVVLVQFFAFIEGFSLETIARFVVGLISPFVYTALISLFGKALFKVRVNYWNLFSTLEYINILAIFIPILIISKSISNWLVIFLVIIFLIYVIILRTKAISTVMRLSMGMAFATMLLAGIIIGLLELGLVILMDSQVGGVVGSATRFTF